MERNPFRRRFTADPMSEALTHLGVIGAHRWDIRLRVHTHFTTALTRSATEQLGRPAEERRRDGIHATVGDVVVEMHPLPADAVRDQGPLAARTTLRRARDWSLVPRRAEIEWDVDRSSATATTCRLTGWATAKTRRLLRAKLALFALVGVLAITTLVLALVGHRRDLATTLAAYGLAPALVAASAVSWWIYAALLAQGEPRRRSIERMKPMASLAAGVLALLFLLDGSRSTAALACVAGCVSGVVNAFAALALRARAAMEPEPEPKAEAPRNPRRRISGTTWAVLLAVAITVLGLVVLIRANSDDNADRPAAPGTSVTAKPPVPNAPPRATAPQSGEANPSCLEPPDDRDDLSWVQRVPDDQFPIAVGTRVTAKRDRGGDSWTVTVPSGASRVWQHDVAEIHFWRNCEPARVEIPPGVIGRSSLHDVIADALAPANRDVFLPQPLPPGISTVVRADRDEHGVRWWQLRSIGPRGLFVRDDAVRHIQ